jgi:hypothetical protein
MVHGHFFVTTVAGDLHRGRTTLRCASIKLSMVSSFAMF